MIARQQEFSVFLFCALCEHCGIGCNRGADELFEGGFVYLFSFVDINRAAHIAFQAGIEELCGILEGRSAGEGELDDLLVGFTGADDAVVREDGRSRIGCLGPLPLFFDGGIGFVNELAEAVQGHATPVVKMLDLRVDVCRG